MAADGNMGVGQQIDDYAGQVAAINQQIDAKVKGGVLPQNDVDYERLKAQRDGLAAKAKDLTVRTEKAGASAPDFTAAVKAKTAELKAPKDGVVQNAAQTGESKASVVQNEAHPLSDTLTAIRAKYPQYKDVPDEKLVDGLYNKFYKDKMSRDEFDQKVGTSKLEPSSVLRSLQIGTEAVGRGLADIAGSVPETVNQVLNIPGRAINTVGSMVSGNDKIVPLLPENASDTIKKAGAAAEKAVGVPERKLTEGEQTASDVEEAATSLGPAIAGVPSAARATGRALVKGGKKVVDTIKTALGTEGKAALGDIRADTAGKVGSAETATKQAATEAEQRAAALQAKKAEVAANQPGKAAARADAATATKPGAPDATLGKKGVLTKLQEETSGIEKEKAAAGAEKTAAEGAVEQATTAEGAAKEAADTLDKTLLEKEGITTEEFGTALEKVVRDASKQLKKTRSKEADFGPVLDRAGDIATQGEKALRVDTSGIEQRIDTILETSVRNATTRRQLEGLKKELTAEVDGKAHSGLTLRQADSLRKTLNSAIQDKVYADSAVDKDALAHLKEIKKMLGKEATKEGDPHRVAYRDALGKHSTYSRPLEFIEKNPLLRKVVADNPDAEEAAVTRSQIVGRLLTEANKSGRKALSRLVVESPELRNAARLHFTEDLFGGPNGLRSMKSDDAMRKWLVKNRPSLDQLGLTGEFKDIKTARDTANRTIADAAGTLKQSKATLAEASKKEADIQKRLGARQKLRDLAAKRVSGKSISDLSGGKVPATPEKTAKAQPNPLTPEQRAKQAKEAQGRLDTLSDAANKVSAGKKKAAQEYTRIATDLGRKNADVPAEAQKAVEALRKGGHITEQQSAQMRDRIDEAVQKTKDTRALRLKIAKIVGAGILLEQVGFPVYRAFMTVIGH